MARHATGAAAIASRAGIGALAADLVRDVVAP
jgi:hypothetical protein